MRRNVLNLFCVLSFVLISLHTFGQDVPRPIKEMFPLPIEPKMTDLIVARNILSASVILHSAAAGKIETDNVSVYAEYRKLYFAVERLKAKLRELNAQITRLDKEKNILYESCVEELAARDWVDKKIRSAKDAQSAGIPEAASDFVQWLTDQGYIKEVENE